MSEINCHGETSSRTRIEPATPRLQICCSPNWASFVIARTSCIKYWHKCSCIKCDRKRFHVKLKLSEIAPVLLLHVLFTRTRDCSHHCSCYLLLLVFLLMLVAFLTMTWPCKVNIVKILSCRDNDHMYLFPWFSKRKCPRWRNACFATKQRNQFDDKVLIPFQHLHHNTTCCP